MVSRSSILHLRIPFSYYLMPVYLLSVCISPNFTEKTLLWTFIIVHIFLYPASNGYNSYFDKDENSIGGLKNPPPVKKDLYYVSLIFDGIAIVLGYLIINEWFAIMLFVYGLVSKAYSHPAIRLKKYAITGWFIAGVFQGLFSIAMCYLGVNNYPIGSVLKTPVVITGLLATLMLWANYPMTQIYQHEEDSNRGDRTFSLWLGIKGTFYFTAAVFAIVTPAFMWYFNEFFGLKYALLFPLAMSPTILFFCYWFVKVLKDERNANHTNTMRLNFFSSTCLNGFFLYVFLDYSHVLQTFQ